MGTAKSEIDPLLRLLKQENSAKTLRKSLEQLGSLVSDSSFRQRLAGESGGAGSSIVLKRHALSLVWQNVILVAIRAIQVLIGTRKPQSLEFTQFSRLMTSLSQPDMIEKDVRPRLSLEVLSKIRSFVVLIFKEDSVVQTAQSELFSILMAVCSRTDFVGSVRPDDLHDIMDIIEPRLDLEQSVESCFGFETVHAAARALELLVVTTTAIGISMHDHIATCIMWVARRCKSFVKGEIAETKPENVGNTSQQTAIVLIRTATMLMRTEPEHSIGPLEIYGSAMLGIARRLYPKMIGASEKDVIVEFLIAYVVVCQVIGSFQGLPQGDLGDLGNGSLGKNALSKCLDLVATPVELRRTSGDDQTNGSNRRAKITWKPLQSRQQRHLELCARLLASAQRVYLAEESWRAMQDPVDHILQVIQFDDSPSAQMLESPQLPSILLPLSVLVQSPFARHILAPLWSFASQGHCDLPQDTLRSSPQGSRTTESHDLQKSDHQDQIFPILCCLSEQNPLPLEIASVAPVLQFLCACAEAFPFGECWSTSTLENWYRLNPDDRVHNQSSLIKTSSADDLGVLVFAVCKILELAGRPGGDDLVQIWALRCLIQLAESTACVASVTKSSLTNLSSAWQGVWVALLRPTLRYFTCSKDTTPFSRGELIFVLLERMTRLGCTDLVRDKACKRRDFLVNQGHAVWNLPTFSDAMNVGSPYVFVLVRSMLQSASISDDKPVGIDERIPDDMSSDFIQTIRNSADEVLHHSNRFKLLCFCLRRFCKEVSGELLTPNSGMLSSLEACCLAIVTGSAHPLCFQSECVKFVQSHSLKLSVIAMKSTVSELGHLATENLWNSLERSTATLVDKVKGVCFLARNFLDARSWTSLVDSPIPRLVKAMQRFSVDYLSAFLSNEFSHDEKVHGIAPLIGKTHVIRLCMAFVFIEKSNVSDSEGVKHFSSTAAAFVDDVIDVLQTSVQCIDGTLTHLQCFVSEIVAFSDTMNGPAHIGSSISKLKEVCVRLLEVYNLSRSCVVDDLSPTVEPTVKSDHLWDSEEEDEEIPCKAIKRRRISVTLEKQGAGAPPPMVVQSLDAASSIARMLLLLEPSIATCELVISKLSVIQASGGFSIRVDIEGAVAALRAICVNAACFSDLNNLIGICIRVIGDIRQDTHGGSAFIGIGFEELDVLLRTNSIDNLTDSTCSLLMSVFLTPESKEKRWIRMRPMIQVDQLSSAIGIYRRCGSTLRDSIRDLIYRNLVSESLESESTLVRETSARVLGNLLCHQPVPDDFCNNIIESQVVNVIQNTKNVPLLQAWCDEWVMRSSSSCWNYSMASLRYFITHLWAMIAGCSNDRSILRRCMSDCLLLAASNPSLELLCQGAIETIGGLRGYESSNQLIADERGFLWGTLFDSRIQAYSIPLTFVSNTLVTLLKFMGVLNTKAWRILQSEGDRVNQLTLQATSEFLTAELPSALPRFMSNRSEQELAQFANVSKNQSEFLGYVDSLLSLSNEYDQLICAREAFLRRHISNVIAQGLLETAKSKITKTPHKLLVFALELGSDDVDENHRSIILYDAVRQLLRIQGDEIEEGLDCECHEVLFSLDAVTRGAWPAVSKIMRSGAVDFLIGCQYWLDRAEADGHKKSRWNTMAMLIKYVLLDERGTLVSCELAFLSVLAVLQSSRMRCCHLSAVTLIGEHLEDLARRILIGKASDVVLISRLVDVLLHVHERCQEGIMNSLRLELQPERHSKRTSFVTTLDQTFYSRNLGYDLSVGNFGIEAFPDVHTMSIYSVEQCKTLARSTYDLVQRVLRLWHLSGVHDSKDTHVDVATFVGDIERYTMLLEFDEKFVAQELFRNFGPLSSHGLNSRDQAMVAKSRFVFYKEKLFPRNESGSHFFQHGTIRSNSRLLLNHAVALRESLRKSGVDDVSTETHRVARHLLDVVSDEGFPSELRFEAGRCLGHIGSVVFDKLVDTESACEPRVYWAMKLPSTDSVSLMTFAVSSVLEFLVNLMKAEPSLSALACLQACKEIASTHEGVLAIKRMTLENSKAFMESLQPHTLKKKTCILTPADAFVRSTIRMAKGDDVSEVSLNDWCWSETLWDASLVSFDEWIRRLVSSIIMCCYRIKRVGNEHWVKGASHSFRALARISAMSSCLSTYLFPRIILDLLLTDTIATGDDAQLFTTVEQSWIGNPRSSTARKITRGLCILMDSLEKCTSEDFRVRGSGLVSFTHDFLRRISQARFLEYSKLLPCVSSAKAVVIRRVPRRFGCTLALEPDTSVHMFVRAGKIASAVYYAETILLETGFDFSTETASDVSAALCSMQSNLMTILRDCMLVLQEFDAASAYALRVTSLGFMRDNFGFLEHSRLVSSQQKSFTMLDMGKKRENRSILDTGSSAPDLRPFEALRTHTDYVYRRERMSESTKASLRETWSSERLSAIDWTVFDDAGFNGVTRMRSQEGVLKALGGALDSLSNEDVLSFQEYLSICRSQVLSQCAVELGLESPLSCVFTSIGYFQLLNDLELIGLKPSLLPSLLARWEGELEYSGCHLGSTPPFQGTLMLAFRERIIEILQFGTINKHDFEEYLTKLQWYGVSMGIEQADLNFAEDCLRRLSLRLSRDGRMSHEVSLKLHLEEAKLIEKRGFFKEAIQITKLIVKTVGRELSHLNINYETVLTELRADSLLLCGVWTRKHKVESAKFVQENYFIPAAATCQGLWAARESASNRRRLSKSCLALAENAALLFESVHTRITSKEWKAKLSFLEEQKRIVRQFNDPGGHLECKTPEELRHLRLTKKLVGRLEDEKERVEEELGPYAFLALQAFGEALSHADRSSNEHWTSHVFRMVSIWFSTHLIAHEVNGCMNSALRLIPTHRFLPLTNQLLSRLQSQGIDECYAFQAILSNLIILMCQHHPYHCLPQLLALIHSEETRESDQRNIPKTRGAAAIMSSLREAGDSDQLDLYNTYDAVTSTYHKLAMAAPSDRHKKQYRGIPIKDFLGRNDFSSILKNARCVPCVLTRPPTVVENHDYGGFMIDPPGTELIHKIHPECCLAPSGLTRPKILVCEGSKRTLFKQLVKGNDDIRQDAIMQQVFSYANELMQRRTSQSKKREHDQKTFDSWCSRKTLKLLTYHVVPLSPQSGILEWVDNTQPFLDYLQDKGKSKRGAHSRFWEGEWSFNQCMEEMTKVSSAKHEDKRRAFDKVCENFSPVFRFFFVEMFGSNLQAWHSAKMAYTRTCAVSSIVGHMLGIGDRHANNILVHQNTGELVHIDFGIVFEQGRLLPTPETVPFRLTRDIVDGMGPLGTEGAFTAAAVETTRMLRKNSDLLLSILTGVVSDPQYEWSKGVSKARARQEDDEKPGDRDTRILSSIKNNQVDHMPTDNLATKHTISRIKEKLQGYEEGTSSEQQSVEAQVQLLINSARDHDNLCAMWRGWAPWL